MDNYRLLIAVVISMFIIVLYSELLQWRHPQPPPNERSQLHGSPGAAPSGAAPSGAATGAIPPTPLAATPAVPSANNGTSQGPRSAPTSAVSAKAAPARTIVVDTSLYHAEFTTRGARLLSFRLQKYRATSALDSPTYEMVGSSARLPFGMLVSRGGDSIDDADVAYTTSAPARVTVTDRGDATITFTATTTDGLQLAKTFTFTNGSYVFGVDAQAHAVTGEKVAEIGLAMSRSLSALEGYHDIPELQADVTGKVVTEQEKALRKGVAPLTGPITYAGFGDRYFLAAFLPQEPVHGTLAMGFSGEEADARMMFAANRVKSRVFMGPKELSILDSVEPALSKAIDFGWTGIIALPFLKALKVFYRIAPNYGLAIILLTIVVRLLTLPMSIKGQRSMMRMQRLAPQVEKIKEKYKDEQERLNREMMDLYKRNHVNPLGGCLPMLVQFPVFIGLYEALLNAVALRNAPFVGWIRDLSAPECLPLSWMPQVPYLDCHGLPVLVILMTITSFLQQWMMPKQPDPSQQKMMMYMPVVFSLIFVNLPAGLTLYYFASNLLGVVQQFVLNREFKQTAPVTT